MTVAPNSLPRSRTNQAYGRSPNARFHDRGRFSVAPTDRRPRIMNCRAAGRPISESLAGVLADAASGRFPPADGGVTIMPQPSPRDAGVIGFTAHAVIFVDADPAWVGWRCPARPRRRRPLGDRHRGRPGPARTRTGPSAGYGRQAPGPSRRAALGARAPGNAASVRACLAAGFAPVGA